MTTGAAGSFNRKIFMRTLQPFGIMTIETENITIGKQHKFIFRAVGIVTSDTTAFEDNRMDLAFFSFIMTEPAKFLILGPQLRGEFRTMLIMAVITGIFPQSRMNNRTSPDDLMIISGITGGYS